MFFYGSKTIPSTEGGGKNVSVPRRGFVVFLPSEELSGGTIACIVSVPRRGFVVFLLIWKARKTGKTSLFQSPEGDSLFFYTNTTFSFVLYEKGFQSPEGDSLFFYKTNGVMPAAFSASFQSPEGDSLFFYKGTKGGGVEFLLVSVPRRGFVVFLPSSGIGGTEMLLYKFQSPEGDSLFFYQETALASIWGRCWFQSPEGDSLFFYVVVTTLGVTMTLRFGFSPPKGIRCFSTSAPTVSKHGQMPSFSPPKGIRCFSTRRRRKTLPKSMPVSVPRRGFVVFLPRCGSEPAPKLSTLSFSPPKGIRCFSTQPLQSHQPFSRLRVSVPRRGFVVFLPLALITTLALFGGFQSPEGDSLFFYPHHRHHQPN